LAVEADACGSMGHGAAHPRVGGHVGARGYSSTAEAVISAWRPLCTLIEAIFADAGQV
jgi:hypothetical protein